MHPGKDLSTRAVVNGTGEPYTPQQPKIIDRCPTCGARSLFIGAGGFLTCGVIGCDNPGVGDAIEQLQARARRLSFDGFQRANVARRNEGASNLKFDQAWSGIDWSNALAGEVGEVCNLTKKEKRDRREIYDDLADEIGDVLTYLGLLAAHYGIDLAAAAVAKFNEISKRHGSSIYITRETP